MTNYNPLIVAIDTNVLSEAQRLAAAVAPYCFGFKFGLEFFYVHGAVGISAVLDHAARVEYIDGGRQQGIAHKPFMLDLKLHDIPSTVGKTIAQLTKINPWAITVHAVGGSDMIRAAVDNTGPVPDRAPMILAVTILTSTPINDADAAARVTSLSHIAMAAGADGVVCSGPDARAARSVVRHGLVVCPGIRPTQDGETEQRRIATPRQAIQQGADYIVVGRPITQVKNPAEAARLIAAEVMS